MNQRRWNRAILDGIELEYVLEGSNDAQQCAIGGQSPRRSAALRDRPVLTRSINPPLDK
jgi:hypothetical protein